MTSLLGRLFGHEAPFEAALPRARGAEWSLELGGERIATFSETSSEAPWTYADVDESPAFDRFRAYFSEDPPWPETMEFELLRNEIRSKGDFVLCGPAPGERYTIFRLHCERNHVWFRYA